jgi:hypothetical protein
LYSGGIQKTTDDYGLPFILKFDNMKRSKGPSYVIVYLLKMKEEEE